MNRYDRRVKILAAALSALAGFVDAIGFMSLGGFFVSFMSGNTTEFAVGLSSGTSQSAVAGGLIVAFVGGVMAGTLAGRLAEAHRATIILVLVSLLLAVAALLGSAKIGLGAAVAMALAMGAENAIFEREGEVHIGLTYMTGTLVKLGQHLTAALMGGPKWAWLPYLLLWLGLVAGACLGALVYPLLGLNALWIAAAVAAVSATAASNLGKSLQ
jgi:uncharacterized membrane protein YoaK (UPF0700 family)